MARNTFYRSGQALAVNRTGQIEGRQHLSALKAQGCEPCPKSGCPRYEKGWDIELNLADPADANVLRYIREGKANRRYTEALLVQGAVRIHFLAEQPCLGHKLGWDDPTLFVGDRKATGDEYINRLGEGVETVNHLRTRGL